MRRSLNVSHIVSELLFVRPVLTVFILFICTTISMSMLPDSILGQSSSELPIEKGLWRCEYNFSSSGDSFVEDRHTGTCQKDNQVTGLPFPVGRAVRWRGFVYAPETGDYTFQVDYNDGARLYVNDEQIIDGWMACPEGCSKSSNLVPLQAGVWYSLVLEYYNDTDSAQIDLKWDTPSGTLEIIPLERLGVDIPTHQSHRIETLNQPFNQTVKGVADVYVTNLASQEKRDYLVASNTGQIMWYIYGNPQPVQGAFSDNSLADADSVYASDLDGDGDNDVLAASNTDKKVVWWRNHVQGTTRYFTESLLLDNFSAFLVRTDDMDKDNDVDIVAVANNNEYGCDASNPQPIVWLENKGIKDSGGYQNFESEAHSIGCGSDQGNIRIADLNVGSGKVVVGTRKEGSLLKVVWWEKNKTVHPLPFEVESQSYVDVGDINGDGYLDIVQTSGNTVRWYKNDGSNNFTTAYLIDDQFAGGSAIVAGDVNGDNKVDIIASGGHSSGNKVLAWYENVGNSTLIKHTISDNTSAAQRISVYDQTEDTDLDIVGVGSNTLTWWQNNLKSGRITIEGPDPAYEYGGKKFAHVWDTSTFIGTISPLEPIWPEPPVFNIGYTWKIQDIHQADHTSTILNDTLIMGTTWQAQGIQVGNGKIDLTVTNPYNPQGEAEGSLNVIVADYTSQDSEDTSGTGPEYRWVDAATGGTKLDFSGGENVEVALPFEFWFYGQKTNTIKVSVDGSVMVGSGRPDVSPTNTSLKTDDDPNVNYFIAPLWETLTLGTSGAVYTKVDGTAPNRRFIIQWDNVTHTSVQGEKITFQAILYEDVDNIKVQYKDVYFSNSYGSFNDGGSATVGIRGISKDFVKEYSYNPEFNDGIARPSEWKSICFYRTPSPPLPKCDKITAPSGVTITGPETCSFVPNQEITLQANVINANDVSKPLTFNWTVDGSTQSKSTRLLSTTDSFTFKWPDDNTVKEQTVRLTVSNPKGTVSSQPYKLYRSAVRFDSGTYSVNEPADMATITATINPPCPYNTSITFATKDNTAIAGTLEDPSLQDYEARIDTVSIPAQTMVITRGITIWNDGKDGGQQAGSNDEADQELVTLRFFNPQNILLADTGNTIVSGDEINASLTIQDDEGPDGGSVTIYKTGRGATLESIRNGSGCDMSMDITPNTVSEPATVLYTRNDNPIPAMTDIRMKPLCAFDLQAKTRGSGELLPTFETSLTMRINYTQAQLTNNSIKADSLRHLFWNGSTWGLVQEPTLIEAKQQVQIMYQQPGSYALVGSRDPYILFDPLFYPANEGTSVTVNPKLDMDPWRPVMVDSTTGDGDVAENGATTSDGDYLHTYSREPITFSFNKRSPDTDFTIQTNQDTKCEGKVGDDGKKREYFVVRMSEEKNGILPTDTKIATVSIIDDDCGSTIVKLVPPSSVEYTEVSDDHREIVFTIKREGDLSVNTDVYWVIDGTARGGIDYDVVNSISPVHFAPGDSEGKVTIRLRDDSEAEGDVSLRVHLVHADGATIVPSEDDVTLTLKDNDDDKAPYGVFHFEHPSYGPVPEGNTGTSKHQVCVVRSLSGMTQVNVDVAIVDESGVIDQDVVRLTDNDGTHVKTLTFLQSDNKKCFDVVVRGDDKVEGDQDFFLILTNPSRDVGIGIQSRVPFTIKDDDNNNEGKIQFVQSTYTVDEASGKATIELERVGGSIGELTADVFLHGITADAEFDYVYKIHPVTFTNGVTKTFITIDITSHDTSLEGTETIGLEIQVPENDQNILGVRNTAQLFIRDISTDTKTVIYFPQTRYTVSEDGSEVLIPVACQGPCARITAYYTTGPTDDSDTATFSLDYEIADYERTKGEVSFANEYVKYIRVTVNPDNKQEGDETLTIRLLRLSDGEASIGTQGEVKVTIVDETPLDQNILQFATIAYVVDERDGYAFVYVERLGDTSLSVTFDWYVEETESTATPGNDYVYPETRSVTIPAGETRGLIKIKITDDKNPKEGPERIVVKLNDSRAGSQYKAVITIKDSPNEEGSLFYFDAAQYWGSEPSDSASNPATVKVICQGENCNGASVKVSLVSGTAISDADYTYEPKTLKFTSTDRILAGTTYVKEYSFNILL